jgi:hypothetical protein
MRLFRGWTGIGCIIEMTSWECLCEDVYRIWKPWWISRHPLDIGEASWVYLFEGGKQLRPRLFCDLWNYLSPETTPCAEVAFAIECVHVASLLLDDSPWMDNASERRGQPTLHCRWSPKKALLLCHDVLEMAYEVGRKCAPQYVTETEWKQMAKEKLHRLCEGQLMDIERQGSCFELASLKTGTLFEWVAEVVAIGVGLDRTFWKIWGNHVGILFQWVDDWMDQEEDRVGGQRNGFLEAREHVYSAYHHLWKTVQQGVGYGWFERPFGRILYSYFTEHVPIRPVLCLPSPSSSLSDRIGSILSSTAYPPLSPIPLTGPRKKGNALLTWLRMQITSPEISNEHPFLSSLWDYPESQWSSHPEIKKWKNRIPPAFHSVIKRIEMNYSAELDGIEEA